MSKPVVKIQDILHDADDAFFEQVVKHLPLAHGGEFDFGVAAQWAQQQAAVIKHWWQYNASDNYNLEDLNGDILITVVDTDGDDYVGCHIEVVK